MAISNYTELKAALSSWMDRNDISANAEDFISLAEAGLNRELELLETDTEITGTVGSRTIDVTSLNIREPVALFIKYQAQEYELLKKPDGTFPYTLNQQEPRIWSVSGDEINFDCLLDSSYTFRFRYTARFALSDDAPTNWLLTKHPDLYLSACIAWGAKFVADDATLQRFGAEVDRFIGSINWQESKKIKGQLNVDPSLSVIKRRYGFYRW